MPPWRESTEYTDAPLPSKRAISLEDCPRCHRSHTSPSFAAVYPRRFLFCFFRIHSTLPFHGKVLHPWVEITPIVGSGSWTYWTCRPTRKQSNLPPPWNGCSVVLNGSSEEAVRPEIQTVPAGLIAKPSAMSRDSPPK